MDTKFETTESRAGLITAQMKTPALIALAEQGKARFFIQFAGQGSVYLDELREIYQTYPLIRPLIENTAQELLEQTKQPLAKKSPSYAFGYDLLDWIRNPATVPPEDYLSTSPISQPLTFLTQIANYAVMAKYGCDQKTFLKHVAGLSGHSQGIMAAVLVAMKLEGRDFFETYLKVVRFLFWQSFFMQEAYAVTDVPKTLLEECEKNNWGKPSPMAAVNGLEPREIQAYLDQINGAFQDHEKLYVSLVNGWKRVIVSGSTQALILLRRQFALKEKRNEKDPTRPFRAKWEFLNVSRPFHCPHMRKALDLFRLEQKRIGLEIKGSDLHFPVYATNDGRDLRASADVVEDLLQMQYIQSVDFDACTKKATLQNGITHIIDFGPGKGVSNLTSMNREGEGVAVISFATQKGKEEFFHTDLSQVRFADEPWAEYAPKLVKVGNHTIIKNRYTEFTGCPPIFGGGMTPTSVETDIVIAATNAGFIQEWAGGGQPTEMIMQRRLEEFKVGLKPGRGIVFNALYLDAYLWTLHYPLLTKFKKEGYPIIGLTISAGIPSLEKAKEIFETMAAHDIWLNSLKPGSDAQIKSVLEIAETMPERTLIMQIEGGKAGGHHSWEDLYGLLERNYAAIRRHKNIIVCVGGGVGAEDQAWTLLEGTWHKSGRLMPIDGVILGTRLMAVKEAKTSPQVKELLVKIGGTPDWVHRHEFKGGVTSGQSQLGADVHYADTQMSRVADEVDRLSDLSEEDLLAKKEKIISLLNKTAKPYFGDIEDMTYAQVLGRLTELLAPGDMPKHFISDGPFFDASYRERLFRFYEVTRNRFRSVIDLQEEILPSPEILDEPKEFLKIFLKTMPQAKETFLHPEDIDHFFAICRLPGKPVNFVPVIDKNLKRWFKSDSLWQAHDPRYAAEEVLTIPGPEAVRGIKRADEPIAEVFGSFAQYVIDHIAKTKFVRALSFLGTTAKVWSTSQVTTKISANEKHVEIVVKEVISPKNLGDFASHLASFDHGAMSALLTSTRILDGKTWRKNFVPHLIFPKENSRIEMERQNGLVTSLTYFLPEEKAPVVVAQVIQKSDHLTLYLYHQSPNSGQHRLDLDFFYDENNQQTPIRLDHDSFQKNLTEFYRVLWLGKNAKPQDNKNIWQEFSSEATLEKQQVLDYLKSVGDTSVQIHKGVVSPAFSVVLLWRPLAACLLQGDLDINLLNLLHLSHEFELLPDQDLKIGQTLQAKARLTSVLNDTTGKTVTVDGVLEDGDRVILKMKSRFLVRQEKNLDTPKFQTHFQERFELEFTELSLALLKEKSWFQISPKLKESFQIGQNLVFEIDAKECQGHNGTQDYSVKGVVFSGTQKVAEISLKEKATAMKQNPVLSFLHRYAKNGKVQIKQKNGFKFTETKLSPLTNETYATASLDLNPIHTDERLAAIADLIEEATGQAQTIVHGLWTSAASLMALNRAIPQRVHDYRSEFLGKVHSKEKLMIKGEHFANVSGDHIFQIVTENEKGAVVHKGVAKVAQAKTAYIFTGQGSQVQGMGMTSYETSEAAQKIWDRADAYSQNALGFSILKVVRDNPKQMLVDGQVVSHPKGVLHLTQFTQVSLTILAMAQIAELREAGIAHTEASFAGHSLGEYAALSCFDFLTLEDVVHVVYNRGLTMQNYVPRDESGASPFGMIVVRPQAVGWSESDLEEHIKNLRESSKTNEAIYVVNYNIEGSQYSVTGHTTLLRKLERELEELNKNPKKPACVWIEGVDVPFHSSLLRDGVDVFRKTLEKIISTNVDYDKLVGRYVPNLNAKVFSFEKDYIADVYKQTDSPVLKQILEKWEEFQNDHAHLGRWLLIELLAYQFASPVQWIKTQKLFLTHPQHRVDRILEIGPSPVLSRMMLATIAKESLVARPQVLQFEDQRKATFFQYEQEIPPKEEETTTPAKPEIQTSVLQPQTAAIPTGASVSVPADQPFSIEKGLTGLLALKLGIRSDEIKGNDTLEALSGGNSAKRNELLSDIGAEFSVDAIDDGHLVPITKLVELLEQKTDYTQTGPVLGKSVERAIQENFPLGKKEILKFFGEERLLPKGLSESALVEVALLVRSGNSRKSGVLSPISISSRLTDKEKTYEWLNQLINYFGDSLGIKIPHQSQAGSGAAGPNVSAEVLKEWQEKFFGKKGPFAEWAKGMAALCDWEEAPQDLRRDFAEELNQLKVYNEAFGPAIQKIVTPLFDLKKKVSFTSFWNWGHEELIRRFWELAKTKGNFTEDEIRRLQNRFTPEIAQTAKYLASVAKKKDLFALEQALEELSAFSPKTEAVFSPFGKSVRPSVTITEKGEVLYKEIERENISTPEDFIRDISGKQKFPEIYESALNKITDEGISFSGKVVLLTGASPGSIAWEVMKNLLQGGATVIATTTSYHEKRLLAYRHLYQKQAGQNAKLHVFPFNQGSKSDIESIVNWCFSQNLVPDFVFPFGAIGETATLTMMTPDASTATLRVLLQGVQWIIGAIAKKHKEVATVSRKTLVVLPLSPNHGVFGGDGAYADSKIGLESLLNRWHSEKEDWGKFVSLIGASIGWVRGTGLMDANNLVAHAMETKAGMRTFSAKEMGWLLTALCEENLFNSAKISPLRVDLTGGFAEAKDLPRLVKDERERIEKESLFKKALFKARAEEKEILFDKKQDNHSATVKTPFVSGFPRLPEPEKLKSFRKTSFDPKQTIVVVGYGEVSPFGSSRPRFEMECGEVSLGGALELAWIMGLIRYEDGNGKLKTIGWVDVESGKLVSDDEIWEKYRKTIEENTGVRFTENRLHRFDPRSALVFGNVTLEQPFSFTVQEEQKVEEYLKEYPETARVTKTTEGFVITLPVGSQIRVPRRVALTRFVAGQLPLGWDAARFGVSQGLIDQVDRNTVFNLVATASAFVSAGLDPKELTEIFSPSLVGNSQGGGMGGMSMLDRIYHDHREDRERQGDGLQETLINVGPAWVTQSFVGSYGPMIHPVAACATALVSLNVGMDLIQQGKAEFVVAGGYDDYSEEGVIGFQDMGATCDTKEMLDKGISPKSMSRPNDNRRGGFVEAQGGGTLLLTSLEQAVDKGLPIYAILGFVGSYSDGVHTSIPAPGLGILGVVKPDAKGETPLGKTLKTFGLTADEMTVVSKHDTSTAVNDPNENKLHQKIQEILGRTKGNPLYVHSQKSILGHGKGGAGAWQSIAAIQILNTGKIPGNKNLENVDEKMRSFSTMSFSDQTLDLGDDYVRSVFATSLGFGHVGAATLFIHPDYALARLNPSERDQYQAKRLKREHASMNRHYRVLLGKEPLYTQRKERPTEEEEIKFLT